jgi:4-hydroxy-tetrahydrodipicolinate reductase
LEGEKMNIIICGVGKMGNAVFDLALKDTGIKIVAGIDRNAKEMKNVMKDSCGSIIAPVLESISKVKNKCDVIIDFSSPSTLSSLIDFAKKNRVALVLCTTGYNDGQLEQIHEISKEIPVFISGNTSLAVNLLIKLAKIAKQILNSEFNIEIIEKHHNQKHDAPSGTALMLASTLSDNDTELVYNRTDVRNKRKNNEIGIHCIRGGTTKGEHEVIFAGPGECLSIKHVAESREIFARGAISAAKFVNDKSSGLYTIDNLIN